VLPGPGAPHGLVIPASELLEQFSRSSGPGGQGVNTADSRVQLSLDLGTTTALNETQRARVVERLSSRLVGSVLTISASEHRAQRQNRIAARERIAMLIRDAIAPRSVHRSTKPTKGSQRRRLDEKSRRSQTKSSRRRPNGQD